MNEERIQSRHTSACITATTLQIKVNNICDSLTGGLTTEETLEMAGSILGDVQSLIGLATQLLMDTDALIKSGEE